jgi:hypothetical protein
MLAILATHNRLRPWALWLALCVACFAAMAPTLSHALPFWQGDGPDRMEICSAQSLYAAAPSADHSSTEPSSGQGSAATQQHCPFCLHTADRLAPPPHHLAYLFMVMGGQQERAVWQAFFYSDNTIFWAPPRGPPTSFALRHA